MKKIFIGLLIVVLLIVGAGVVTLGRMGYIPWLAALLGADKPRDLGVSWSEADLKSGAKKHKVDFEFGTLPADTPLTESVVYTGEREISSTHTSAEITALMNSQDYAYWPFVDCQFKFNADGSFESSGKLDKSRIESFANAIAIPSEVGKRAAQLLPPDPVYYLKGTAVFKDNKITVFDPQVFEIGRVKLPISVFLSYVQPQLIEPAYADSATDIQSELDKYENKREWIINYINSRVNAIPGFYAKDWHIEEDALVFDGTLPESVQTVGE